MKRAREESPDNLPDQSQSNPENDEVRIVKFFHPDRLFINFSQGVVSNLLGLFPSLPRKHLENEVAKSRSAGESFEVLANRLLDESSLIDLTGPEEAEEKDVGAAEAEAVPEPGQ